MAVDDDEDGEDDEDMEAEEEMKESEKNEKDSKQKLNGGSDEVSALEPSAQVSLLQQSNGHHESNSAAVKESSDEKS